MNIAGCGIIISKWFILNGVKILLILVATILLFRFIDIIINRLIDVKKDGSEEHKKNLQTVCSIFKSCAKFVVFAVASMLILQELGVNIAPILAAAGILGVAVSFGSQKLVEDLISGFIILLNNQLRVGDIVEIEGKCGRVEKITLSIVVLKEESGNMHFIRNGRIGVITRKNSNP